MSAAIWKNPSEWETGENLTCFDALPLQLALNVIVDWPLASRSKHSNRNPEKFPLLISGITVKVVHATSVTTTFNVRIQVWRIKRINVEEVTMGRLVSAQFGGMTSRMCVGKRKLRIESVGALSTDQEI